MHLFKDEHGQLITEKMLEQEFALLQATERGEYDYNFEKYIRNCTNKNGTLTELSRNN